MPLPVGASMAIGWRACRARPLGDRRLPGLAGLPRDGGPAVPGGDERAGGRPPAGWPSWRGSWGWPRGGPAPGSPGWRPPGSWDGPGGRSPSPTRPTATDPGFGDSIGRGGGVVFVPRRVLRLLAGGNRQALIATALGLLLRCVSRRRGGFEGRGRVKVVVDRPGLRRRPPAGRGRKRRELVALGWIAPEPADQWAENRWGRAYRVDLAWAARRAAGRRRLPPPPADPGRRIATP